MFGNRFLALGHISIYFDGRGMKMIQNKTVNYSYKEKHRVDIRVTRKECEVDDLVVDIVKDRRRKLLSQLESNYAITATHIPLESLKTKVSKLPLSLSEEEESFLYTLTRNGNGPGKARSLLKTYCLLRPSSVYSLPWITPQLIHQSMTDIDVLIGNKSTMNHFQSHVDRKILAKDAEAIVVTDDVYFRQRVVEAGGIVLTFEQLWLLLQD